jgi:hypothetical protein
VRKTSLRHDAVQRYRLEDIVEHEYLIVSERHDRLHDPLKRLLSCPNLIANIQDHPAIIGYVPKRFWHGRAHRLSISVATALVRHRSITSFFQVACSASVIE